MLSVNNVSLNFGKRKLFDEVNITFVPGNCYGVIGANGSGKSTFLKILAGELEQNTGTIEKDPAERLAVLKQDHFAFNEYPVINTVIMGHEKLARVMQEREEIYAKQDFSDADGLRAAELENEFSELNGWEAESQAAVLLKGLGVSDERHHSHLKTIPDIDKVKVLLAQALFGNPDILLLDEPTNHLDLASVVWLENFIMELSTAVIVVSHDRHFLNKVCTHIVDIDFGKVNLYTGNYDFWKESSELALQLKRESNKKMEDKRKDLESFIQRFSANASKARQATSRKKLLEKLTLEDIVPSTRKYPYIMFTPQRETGKDILRAENLSKTSDGIPLFSGVSFTLRPGDKAALISSYEASNTALLEVLSGNARPDQGSYTWGQTITPSYLPKDNASFFIDNSVNLIDWLRFFSEDKGEEFIRGFLGRMLFSGDETLKSVSVLSGGEKVRCMISRMMLSGANVLLLDGPTNHLDLESIASFNEALIKFPGVILLATHDLRFIQTVANRILDIGPDFCIDRSCTYEEYSGKKP